MTEICKKLTSMAINMTRRLQAHWCGFLADSHAFRFFYMPRALDNIGYEDTRVEKQCAQVWAMLGGSHNRTSLAEVFEIPILTEQLPVNWIR